MSFTLAIDQGTQSSRAVLFNSVGDIVARERQKVEIYRIKPGYVEQDAAAILNSVKQVVDRLLNNISLTQRQSIDACGICTQRSSLVACNPQGEAISPVVSWQDTRASEWLRTLADKQSDIQKISGLPLTAHYGASKLKWLFEHSGQPDSNKILLAPLVSYLLMNLIQDKPFVVDHSNAQRTQLMDIKTLDWSNRLLKLFKIPARKLPVCNPVMFNYGALLDRDITVKSVCGDQNAVFCGASHNRSGTAVINLGTGAFIMCPYADFKSDNSLLTTLVKSNDQSAAYVMEGTVNGAGSALNWAKNKYHLGDLKKSLPGWLDSVTNPPVFINSVGGIGSPWWVTDIAPQFVESAEYKKAEVAVAVVESIVFLIQDNLSVMQKTQSIERVLVSGGLSNLDGLCQKLANVSGLPVERVENIEASARGVAWLAAGEPDDWRQSISARFNAVKDAGLCARYEIFRAKLMALIAA